MVYGAECTNVHITMYGLEWNLSTTVSPIIAAQGIDVLHANRPTAPCCVVHRGSEIACSDGTAVPVHTPTTVYVGLHVPVNRCE